MIRNVLCAVLLCLLALSGSVRAESVSSKVRKAIKALHRCEDIAKNAELILASNVSGDYLYKALSKKRKYPTKVKKSWQYDSVELEAGYSLKYGYQIPGKYNPKKPLPVLFILHGGVTTPTPHEIMGLSSNMAGGMAGIVAKTKEPFIFVVPQGSEKAPWWTTNGLKMVLEPLKKIKRTYNIDTNRVYVTGFSDGGSGSFFCACVSASHFAAVFPMNGMLSNAAAKGYRVFIHNLRNTPIFACNTTLDSLYPPGVTQPIADAMKDAGVELYFKMFENIGHQFSYKQKIADDMAKWLMEKRRNPWGKKVEWATHIPSLYGRCDWIEIVELGNTETSSPFEAIPVKTEKGGLFTSVSGAGYVNAERDGNSFSVKTNNVSKFRIVLSPEMVDFKTPVIVVVNGGEVFNGLVEYDAKSVIESFVKDEDINTLAAKYLEVEVP